MRARFEKERRGYLLRFWSSDYRDGEIAWIFFGLRGLRLTVEFPSDWHEHKRVWLSIGLGLLCINVSFPWRGKVVLDHGQCSGPRYGFYFFDDHLVVLYGKSKGTRDDPSKFISMPWSWQHKWHSIDGEKFAHPYRYVLKNGTVQDRTATIQVQSRQWRRYWIPWIKTSVYIDVEFNDEVGERSGSWKGGTLGCSYEMKRGESPLECLRRMERERKL